MRLHSERESLRRMAIDRTRTVRHIGALSLRRAGSYKSNQSYDRISQPVEVARRLRGAHRASVKFYNFPALLANGDTRIRLMDEDIWTASSVRDHTDFWKEDRLSPQRLTHSLAEFDLSSHTSTESTTELTRYHPRWDRTNFRHQIALPSLGIRLLDRSCYRDISLLP